MPNNIQIILVAGAAVLFLVILYLFFRPIFTRKLIQNSLNDSQSGLFNENLEQGTLGFEDDIDLIQEQELIILNLVSIKKLKDFIDKLHMDYLTVTLVFIISLKTFY